MKITRQTGMFTPQAIVHLAGSITRAAAHGRDMTPSAAVLDSMPFDGAAKALLLCSRGNDGARSVAMALKAPMHPDKAVVLLKALDQKAPDPGISRKAIGEMPDNSWTRQVAAKSSEIDSLCIDFMPNEVRNHLGTIMGRAEMIIAAEGSQGLAEIITKTSDILANFRPLSEGLLTFGEASQAIKIRTADMNAICLLAKPKEISLITERHWEKIEKNIEILADIAEGYRQFEPEELLVLTANSLPGEKKLEHYVQAAKTLVSRTNPKAILELICRRQLERSEMSCCRGDAYISGWYEFLAVLMQTGKAHEMHDLIMETMQKFRDIIKDTNPQKY